MDEIEMMPADNGTWVMVCPCGQAERRGRGAKAWRKFTATILPDQRYRVCCAACGRCMEHQMIYGITRATRQAPS